MSEQAQEISFKSLFVPFTPLKAVHYIILIGVIVYANGLSNTFLGDDFLQITNNVSVHSLTNIGSFFFGSTFYNGQGRELSGAYFKPFLSASYAVIYTLFKDTPFWYHLFQLILHITNTAFLYLVFRYFLKNSTSFILSLLFLVHPINSQSVFYIAAFQEPLFFFYGIVAFWLLLKFKCEKYLHLIVILLLFSIFSKETGILFFVLCGFYIFLYHKKYFKIYFIYSLLSLAVYFILRFHAVGLAKNPHTTPIDGLNLFDRLLHVPAILLFYFKTFIFPAKLSWTNNWSISTFNYNTFYLPLIIILVLLASAIITGILIKKYSADKYFKSYLFFLGTLTIGLLLHIQIIPLDMITCESWFYFPIVGLLGMIGVTYESLWSKVNKKMILLLASIVILVLSIRTIYRSFDWRSEITMIHKDLDFNMDNYAADENLALYLYQQDKLDESQKMVEESIQRYPRALSYNLLGLIYFERGDFAKAREAYVKGLKKGGLQLQYESMAQLGIFYGRPEDNIHFINYGLQKYPNDLFLWQYLAISFYKLNKIDEAKMAIENAYKLNPSTQMAITYKTIINKQKLNMIPKNL
ncbi:MAG: tetratricopeptide repeat protein [Candidatus Levyibacteriota bacterium]